MSKDYREGFKAGYNAALDRARERTKAEFDTGTSVLRGDLLRLLGEMRSEMALPEGGVTAPASSELGVELSRIRDRINALEARPHVTVDAFAELRQHVDVLHENQGRQEKRLEVLELFRRRIAEAT